MNTRQSLLDAIRRFRADDTARLAFADYLEGDADPPEPERAEFVRVQVELGRMNPWYDPYKQGVRDTRGIPVAELDRGDRFRKRVRQLWEGHGRGKWGIDIPDRHVVLTPVPGNDFGLGNGDVDGVFYRGFIREIQCSWQDWSANAARILPEHPGLERVVLTTPPVIDYRRHERDEDNYPARHLRLEARAAGMRATAERVVSRHEIEHSSFDLISMTWEHLHHDLRPESVLALWWGGDPAEGKWGVTFELPRPDAHGGQYRHWEPGMRYRHTPVGAAIEGAARDIVRRMAEQFAEQDAAAVERILRDLLAEHGITEDDLRSGRRQVTRLTTTGGRNPDRFNCACGEVSPDRPLTVNAIELRDRVFASVAPGPLGTRYRIADGICPSCSRLYFAVTREER